MDPYDVNILPFQNFQIFFFRILAMLRVIPNWHNNLRGWGQKFCGENISTCLSIEKVWQLGWIWNNWNDKKDETYIYKRKLLLRESGKEKKKKTIRSKKMTRQKIEIHSWISCYCLCSKFLGLIKQTFGLKT